MLRRTCPGIAVILAFCLFSCAGRDNAVSNYETQALRRGSIVKTVGSTGSLEPIATVNIRSQISGKVERLLADYNDEVKKGDVLAILNTDTRRLQRDQLLAQVQKARSAYELQKINYQNQEKLAERNLISQYELRQNRNQMEAQAADLAIAEANLKVAETEINQYAFITSPVDGTVLSRGISEGETVADGASANSTAIFVIAENLREMRIESWVGELDINSIREGQDVRFTLEALPGRSFSGVVSSKRLSPSTQDGVVSYSVIIAVNNADLSLLPGMTCNVEFIEDSRENVFLAPNAALRYSPSSLSDSEIELITAEKRGAALEKMGLGAEETRGTPPPPAGGENRASRSAMGGLPGTPFGGPPGGGRGRAGSSASPVRAPQGPQLKPLWFINSGGKFDCVMVAPGISDGSVTEVSSPDLTEDLIAGTRFILREKVK
ncbi:MAG: efflux RND transporter periplasmic adaptor subunit [Treponema sp.]|jgi:HlyD family secretion protein|nr:efflux RND transporter periplasmic adaptor subunit [Treponema sp.]